MRKGLLVVLLFTASCVAAQFGRAAVAAAGATPASTARPPTQREKALAESAPADVYFGPQGMSPLSIRSTIGFLGRQYHYRTISDRDLLRKALITEDALRRWRTKYPKDPWLAPTFFHLEQLYQAVQTQEARKHATAILKDVVANYPDTKQGHMSRSRLAAGFPPLTPETPLLASPPPAAGPSPSPSASGGESPGPEPSAAAGASASPSAQPSSASPAASSSPAGAASPG
jgi:hypothetical protein